MTTHPTPTAEDRQAAQAMLAELKNPQWSLAAAQLEDELDCEAAAGIPAHQLSKFWSNPAAFCEQQRLKTLVFQGLHQLLAECDLGAGLPAAQTTGKQLLNERLQQPSVEIQQQLLAVLDEDLSSSRDVPLPAEAQASLRQVIVSVLSQEDWEAISAAAVSSLQQHFRTVVAVALPQPA